MAGKKAALRKYLKGSVTAGSSDAFVQGSITTGLSGETKVAYRVRELWLELPNMDGADQSVEVTFTRKSFAAIPALTEKSVIWRLNRVHSLTTSGSVTFDRVIKQYFAEDDDSFIIVEDPLYMQHDTAALSTSAVVSYVIGYDEVSISEDDRMALLVAALQ